MVTIYNALIVREVEGKRTEIVKPVRVNDERLIDGSVPATIARIIGIVDKYAVTIAGWAALDENGVPVTSTIVFEDFPIKR